MRWKRGKLFTRQVVSLRAWVQCDRRRVSLCTPPSWSVRSRDALLPRQQTLHPMNAELKWIFKTS